MVCKKALMRVANCGSGERAPSITIFEIYDKHLCMQSNIHLTKSMYGYFYLCASFKFSASGPSGRKTSEGSCLFSCITGWSRCQGNGSLECFANVKLAVACMLGCM